MIMYNRKTGLSIDKALQMMKIQANQILLKQMIVIMREKKKVMNASIMKMMQMSVSVNYDAFAVYI